MTQLREAVPDVPDRLRSPHQLTQQETLAARATYERLGYHRYLHWSDLPDWQQAGYHHLSLIDQVAAMQRVHQLTTAIDNRHNELVQAVVETIRSNGWQLMLLSYCAPPTSSMADEHQFHALVRQVLLAAADHLTPRVVSP